VAVKGLLSKESIPFKEIIVEQNKDIWNKVKEQVGEDCLLPSIFIQENTEGVGTIYIPGRDFHSAGEILTIIKNKIGVQ
jgi:glutaredoxin